MLGEMVHELTRYRGLLGMLAWRDIRVRYKQSLLGVTWAFLMPLIQTAVLYTVFSFGPVQIDQSKTGGMNYLLFVLSGVVPWTFFSATLTAGLDSLTRNSRLVTKIYFPREVFPFATVLGAMVDCAIACAVAAPIYIYFAVRGEVRPSLLLLGLPVVFAVQVMLVAGLSLVLSMANLFFRDVKYIMTFVLQLWFFATNVVYPIRFEQHPALRWIATANPMIGILDAYRDLLMGRPIENMAGLAIAGAISVVAFIGGWRIFHQAEFKFAEYV